MARLSWGVRPISQHVPMNTRRPIFTILSLLIAGLFVLVSRPLLDHSIDRQMDAIDFHSESAEEDTSRMSGLAFLAGQIMACGLGAAVGAIFAGIGFWRRERWRTFRWITLAVNLVITGLIVFAIGSDIATGAIRFAD